MKKKSTYAVEHSIPEVEGRELQRVEPGGQAEHVVSAEGDVLDHIELYPLSRQLAEALKAVGIVGIRRCIFNAEADDLIADTAEADRRKGRLIDLIQFFLKAELPLGQRV